MKLKNYKKKGRKVLEIYYLVMTVARIVWARFWKGISPFFLDVLDSYKSHIYMNLIHSKKKGHINNSQPVLGAVCLVSVLAETLDQYLLNLGINIKPSRWGHVMHPLFFWDFLVSNLCNIIYIFWHMQNLISNFAYAKNINIYINMKLENSKKKGRITRRLALHNALMTRL